MQYIKSTQALMISTCQRLFCVQEKGMLEKILLVLAVAILAAGNVKGLSEEASDAASSTESPTVTLLKTKLSCLNQQLKVCERMLTKVGDCKGKLLFKAICH